MRNLVFPGSSSGFFQKGSFRAFLSEGETERETPGETEGENERETNQAPAATVKLRFEA